MNRSQAAGAAPLPVLYSFRRCPYAIRARLALRQAGIACELREVVLRNKPAAMLELSPKGTVPVLALPAAVLDESLDIMRWALTQRDPDGWLAADPGATEQLIAANDGAFKRALDRYKYPDRYPDADRAVALAECERFVADLDRRLTGRAGLVAPQPSLADFALLPFVRQFALVDREWLRASPYAALRGWLNAFLDSPLFAAIMHKYEPWQPGAAGVVF
ncbi:MAG: glutathione S-transferase [Gammaproteobacteria bacterium]|jgi:glutathione S-transferase|nr:glutathione S-transferase [Gammaproteobacteria bacterium]